MKVSFTALVAAQSADMWSSIGRYEANPLLRDRHGVFSPTKGIAIKAATTAGLLYMEHFVIRRHPSTRKTFAVLNFVIAGAIAGVAARNRSVQ